MKIFAKTVCKKEWGNETIEYCLFVTDPFICDEIKENVFSVLGVTYREGVAVEDAFVYDVCRDEATALRVLEILRRNGVHPCQMSDVIADLR